MSRIFGKRGIKTTETKEEKIPRYEDILLHLEQQEAEEEKKNADQKPANPEE